MKKTTSRVWWCQRAFALCLLASTYWASAQPVAATGAAGFEFGYVEQPPRTYTNAKGEAEGQVIVLMRDLFAKAGIPWRAAPYPAARLFENLKDGTTQFSVLIKVPSLQNYCLWSKVELGGEDIRVYWVGDKPPISRREELAGKSVIALRGYSYGGLASFLNDAKNDIALNLAASNPDSFEMLAAGRADYLVQYAEASERQLQASPLPDVRYTVIGRISRHLVVSRAMPEAEKTMERLEEILKAMDVTQYLKTTTR